MAEHTETPWFADPDLRAGMEWNIHIVEHNNPNNRICFMTSSGPSAPNAAFIVKACNAHDALVKALEEALACLRHTHDRLIEGPEFETLRITIDAECRAIRTTLAQVKS